MPGGEHLGWLEGRDPVVIDLYTLYLVILLQSATLAVLWLAIWRCYRDVEAARFWVAANLLSVVGGAIMAIESRPGPLHPVLLGNLVVMAGHMLTLVGVCRFYGRPVPWRVGLGALLVSALVLFLFEDDRIIRNGVYMLGHGVPLLIAAVLLARYGQASSGARFTAYMLAGSVIGGAVPRFAALVLHQTQIISSDHYNPALFATLLATIFGKLMWSFGLLLMVVERLQAKAGALAVVDELTGLANRRMLLSQIEEETRAARRLGRGFAVMVIDIDHFKAINDAYGHGAGDACLIHFSRVASARLREGDLLARLGGDEFCLLLRGADGPGAERVGAELLQLIRTVPVDWPGASIPLTLSIGIALWDPQRHADTLSLMEEADRALYLVKRQGRNGCALARPEDVGARPLPRLALAP